MILAGAALALSRNPDLRFLLVGRSEEVAAGLESLPALKAASEIVHADEVIGGGDKPAQAIRRANGSKAQPFRLPDSRSSFPDGHPTAVDSTGSLPDTSWPSASLFIRLKISSRWTETDFGASTPSRTWLPLTRSTVTDTSSPIMTFSPTRRVRISTSCTPTPRWRRPSPPQHSLT